VFVLQFGAFRFFAGGDLTWNLEEQLVAPYNRVGAVDVYQTNHHGLDQSNNPILVQSLEPTVVVMNNGPYKGGQAGSFAAIRSAPSVQAFYQLHKSFNAPDQNGDGEYIANFANVRPAEAHKCTANLIKLSVAPDGRSYTVSIPASGHSRTFQTKGR
jgi:competence protein ComEC